MSDDTLNEVVIFCARGNKLVFFHYGFETTQAGHKNTETEKDFLNKLNARLI